MRRAMKTAGARRRSGRAERSSSLRRAFLHITAHRAVQRDAGVDHCPDVVLAITELAQDLHALLADLRRRDEGLPVAGRYLVGERHIDDGALGRVLDLLKETDIL